MIKHLAHCVVLLLVTMALAGCAEPGPAFVTGRYRNLFAEGWLSQGAIDGKVEGAFQQLFHGNQEMQAIYFADGANDSGALAYICDISHDDVRTEGMSYGMMICVQLGKKAEFDALWNWARTHMYHEDPRHPGFGFFSWQVGRDGKAIDEMPACDGEEYFATALYFAAHRWGNGAGIYDYGAAADRLLHDMRHRGLIRGMTVAGPRVGRAMFIENPPMVRFAPSENYTDPSYQLPAFYELWAIWGPVEDRDFWARAAVASRDFLHQAANSRTALTPDYANFDGTPRPEATFHYDAWRTGANVAIDWAWWGKDARERGASDRLQAFFKSQGLARYGNQFSLEGKELSDVHSSGLVSMNAVSSLAAMNWGSQDFVQALWKMPVPTGKYRYYDGCLYMLAMLECSGRFRIWMPKG